jgi:hypothetical protein
MRSRGNINPEGFIKRTVEKSFATNMKKGIPFEKNLEVTSIQLNSLGG